MSHGRLGHNLYLRHACRPLAVTCADAVAACVAAAYYKHVLATCRNTFVFAKGLSGQNAVLLREHFHCEVYAFQPASFDFQVARLRCAYAHAVCVEPLRQVGEVDFGRGFETYAFGTHYVKTAVDDWLMQFEIRYSEPQQPAYVFLFFEYGNVVSHAVQPVCGGQPGGARPYYGHLHSVARIIVRLHVSLAKGSLGYGGFVFAYRYGSVHAQF